MGQELTDVLAQGLITLKCSLTGVSIWQLNFCPVCFQPGIRWLPRKKRKQSVTNAVTANSLRSAQICSVAMCLSQTNAPLNTCREYLLKRTVDEHILNTFFRQKSHLHKTCPANGKSNPTSVQGGF